MTFRLEESTGADLSLDRDNLTIVRKFRVLGTLPYSSSTDAFDAVASVVIGLIRMSYPTYQTDMGLLFWNSIQLHENFYAQNYDISVTYSPLNKQSGAYQITVDQAVGNAKVTAGTRIAGYPTASCPDNEGTFFDGTEITGVDVPVAEDRIMVSYRHPQAFLNIDYIRRIGTLRGYPNSDAFLGYAAGEVMYMGGNFTQSDCEATATYNFAISPNVTNLVIGGITVTAKSGFDAVSPVYKPDTDVSGDGKTHAIKKLLGIEIIRPRAHKVYQSVFGWGGT